MQQPSPLRFIGLLLVFAAACMDASSRAPEETSTTSQAVTYCNSDCDCNYGSYCSGHQCVGDFGPFAPCYCAARDCPAGYNACSGGFCATTCSSNCDCPYGSYCSGGSCVGDFGPFAPCYCGSRDCGPNQYCVGWYNDTGFCSGDGGSGG